MSADDLDEPTDRFPVVDPDAATEADDAPYAEPVHWSQAELMAVARMTWRRITRR